MKPYEPSPRSEIEDAGFEALQRLYAVAITDTGQARRVAAFLLGVYNGTRFPFDLSDLRALDLSLVDDCLAVLRMDGRQARKPICDYFDHGEAKFEALVRLWNVEDTYKLRQTGDGSPRPLAQRGRLQHEDHVNATLVTYGHAPGYRDASLVLDCEVMGAESAMVGPVRLSLRLGHKDTESLLHHLQYVHASAWRGWPGRTPLDAPADAQRPSWLDRSTASAA